jgi:predicted XRE-type DNA-binding protein
MGNIGSGAAEKHGGNSIPVGRPIEVSDNLFADLGLKDAEEYNAKAQLALAIRRFIRERSITQKSVAAQAGVKQSDLSNIVNGRLDGISMERLTNVLNNLDQDVEISIRPKRTERARTYVNANDTDLEASITASAREE